MATRRNRNRRLGRGPGGHGDSARARRRCGLTHFARVLAMVTAGYAGIVTSFVLALRFGSPRVRNAVRRFNRRILNPVMLRLAGHRHWYAAALQHVGRRSGRTHATPVVAIPVADGFIIPLPYGDRVDWLENIRASGTATIDVKGTSHDVTEPEVLPASQALRLVDASHRRAWRLFGIELYLRLRAEQGSIRPAAWSVPRSARVRPG